MYVLTDPAAVQHILITRQDNYVKPAVYAAEMAPIMGSGLLTSEGADWLSQRRTSQPIFQSEQLSGLLHVVRSCTNNLFKSWEPIFDEWIDLYKDLLHLTNTIAVEWMFGADQDNDARVLKSCLVETLFNMKMLDANMQTSNVWGTTEPTIDRFKRLIGDLISKRRLSPDKGDDLLAYYIAVLTEQSGTSFGEQELFDEVRTLTIGGHHNVAAALSWTFYLLARNSDVQQKLQHELDNHLANESDTVHALGEMRYLRAVLQESMRLYPPVWGTSREAVKDDTIDGYEIPAGSLVFLCQWITQRHSGFWEEPDTFDPDRFLNHKTDGVNKFAYFPFGRGPRQCIAQDLAMMEMMVIAAELGRTYQFDLPSDWIAEIDPGYVLAPKGGLPVRLVRRD